MKKFALVIALSLVVSLGYTSTAKAIHQGKHNQIEDLAEKEEFRQTYQLTAGTKVDISDISGLLEVETVEGNTAELYVVYSANSRKDLEFGRIKGELSNNILRIGTEPRKAHITYRNHEVRQRVYLKLPRQVDLTINDISGLVDIGKLGGTLNISDISGKVQIEQVANCPKISDISGMIDVGVVQLPAKGMTITDISGKARVRFVKELNADLHVDDISGNISVHLPSLTITNKDDENNFQGRIGSGGAIISVSDISGTIELTQSELR